MEHHNAPDVDKVFRRSIELSDDTAAPVIPFSHPQLRQFPGRNTPAPDAPADAAPLRPTDEMTAPRFSTIVYASDAETFKSFQEGLTTVVDDVDIRHGNIETCIKAFETVKAPTHVVVDISGIDNPRAAIDDLARVCPPDIHVYMVGEDGDIAFYRHLVQDLGITEYLVKPVTRDAVKQLILPHLTGQPSEQQMMRGGHVVAVCGARGGVGTSSIALCLAYELKDAVKGHVALVDLHIHNGEIALMLGKRPGSGLRMALEVDSDIDNLFLDRVAIELEPRLRLIASQERWNTPSVVNENSLVHMIELLQRKFNFVVVDIPMPLPPHMEPILKLSREVVVVLTPDVASLRDTQNIRDYVTEITGTDRVLTVLNRYDMAGHVDQALAVKTLGRQFDITIPELGGPMLEAINLGVPATRHVPALRRHMAPLVKEISGVAPHAESLIKRVFHWGRRHKAEIPEPPRDDTTAQRDDGRWKRTVFVRS